MQDILLADEVIKRLNLLLEDPAVRNDLTVLFNQEIVVNQATADHPTLQVRTTKVPGCFTLTVLGLLNGIVGAIPSGAKEGWGYVTAIYNDNRELIGFERTDHIPLRG